MFVLSAKPRFKLLLLALLLLPCTAARPVLAHGSHGGGDEQLEAGEFDFTPLITIEGHGGFETNLDDNPKQQSTSAPWCKGRAGPVIRPLLRH